MTARAHSKSEKDLFAAQRVREQKESSAPKPALSGLHVCAFCGRSAPFGKGSVRAPEKIIWACREHRGNLG
jgi:hypothetical protein